MGESPKKSGGLLAARRCLKLVACVLSVSAALGGQPIIEIPAEHGRSLRISIVHVRFDAEGDPGVHGS
jgi:hypothetical protein